MEPEGTVFVVDDDPEVRQALTRLLESVHLPHQVFSNAKEFLEAYDPASAGCLVLDVRLPGMSGIELHRHLAAKGVALPVIMISGHGDIPMAVDALQRGAVSFLEKPIRPQQLLDQIQQVLARDSERREHEKEREALRARLALLTPRERPVLEGMVVGKSTKEIAVELGLSPKTVDFHRLRIMGKMQANSLAELVRMVLKTQSGQESPRNRAAPPDLPPTASMNTSA